VVVATGGAWGLPNRPFFTLDRIWICSAIPSLLCARRTLPRSGTVAIAMPWRTSVSPVSSLLRELDVPAATASAPETNGCWDDAAPIVITRSSCGPRQVMGATMRSGGSSPCRRRSGETRLLAAFSAPLQVCRLEVGPLGDRVDVTAEVEGVPTGVTE